MTEDKILITEHPRHSKHLIEAIKMVRERYPEADTFLTENKKIQVRANETVLSGEHDTQWDAWMEAKHGASRTQ